MTRTVRVIDTGKPIITLTGDNPQTIEFGMAYTELNATATDRVDGDLTGSIVIDSSAVNTDRVGRPARSGSSTPASRLSP